MSQIQMETREAIIAFLPGAIVAALLSYSRFLEEQATAQDDTDAKNFKAHHDACKVAIAHIELLVKLANSVCLANNQRGDVDDAALARLIMSAQTEVDENELD